LLVGNVGTDDAIGQFGCHLKVIFDFTHIAKIVRRLTAWKDKHFFNFNLIKFYKHESKKNE